MKFTTSLSGAEACIVGGFGASGALDPSQFADDVFGAEVPGPWLCCYMIRRFGWPNSGSDDYKELCSWTLTTPMAGLYLGVTPYLGSSNLHFSLRYNATVRDAVRKDPVRDAFFARKERALQKWWDATGSKLYTFGCAQKDGKEDKDEIVLKYCEDEKEIWGLWKRTAKHNWPNTWKTLIKRKMDTFWLIGKVIQDFHPSVKLPRLTKKWSTPRFHIRCRAAIKAALRDLLRPTNVRDISFTPFGDIERTPEAIERVKGQKHADYFEGAGNAPSYWYSAQRKHDEKKRGARR